MKKIINVNLPGHLTSFISGEFQHLITSNYKNTQSIVL